MGRCSGCGGDRCGCVIEAGANISITGAGTTENPMVIEGTGAGGGGGAGPVGSIIMFSGTAAPAGYLLCNGQSVSRTAFAALFAVVGTRFGAGDGSTTFAVPNMTGAFPYGATATRPLGSKGGAETVALAGANLPTHVHTMNHGHGDVNSGAISADHSHSGGTSDMSANHAHGFNVNTAVGGGHEHFQATRSGATGFGNNAPAQSNGANNDQRSTTGGGGHAHNVAGGTDWGNSGHTHSFTTGGVSSNHSHLVTTPAFNGDTGAAGSATPAAVNVLNPFLALTFLIKT